MEAAGIGDERPSLGGDADKISQNLAGMHGATVISLGQMRHQTIHPKGWQTQSLAHQMQELLRKSPLPPHANIHLEMHG